MTMTRMSQPHSCLGACEQGAELGGKRRRDGDPCSHEKRGPLEGLQHLISPKYLAAQYCSRCMKARALALALAFYSSSSRSSMVLLAPFLAYSRSRYPFRATQSSRVD